MIVGTNYDRQNPEYTISDLIMWMPSYRGFFETEEGMQYFNMLYEIANNKIFYSVFTGDWKYAMSLCILHYLTLISQKANNNVGSDLSSLPKGNKLQGILSGMSVGGFSKDVDVDKVLADDEVAKFWNQTNYGVSLYALWKTKPRLKVAVVLPNQVDFNSPNSNYGNKHDIRFLQENINALNAKITKLEMRIKKLEEK